MDYKEKVEWLGRYQASVSCQHMLEEEIEVLRSDAELRTASLAMTTCCPRRTST